VKATPGSTAVESSDIATAMLLVTTSGSITDEGTW
jgi:hypothetical protein